MLEGSSFALTSIWIAKTRLPCILAARIPPSVSYQPTSGSASLVCRMQCSAVAKSTTYAPVRSDTCRFKVPPLEPRSSAGRVLRDLFLNHSHLLNFALREVVEMLVAERDAAVSLQENSVDSSEAVLYRKIAELKETERQVAVEDVMYFSIANKFSSINVPMISALSTYVTNGRLQLTASGCEELESIHENGALEMVKEHLTRVFHHHMRSDYGDRAASRIHSMDLGHLYALSAIYGYFLKSVSLRYKLESAFEFQPSADPFSLMGMKSQIWRQMPTLKTYVSGFDSMALQRCAKLKSHSARNLIEKQTWALFGDGKLGVNSVESYWVTVTASSLRRLVLEAVAFGVFLWDVERDLDSLYMLEEC